ncbi:hypothetical protein NDU88_002352 [Pleurodeles waltl]|uniref:Uncharacterized protein n=1 Tax=Pleurodeles waltl TaxID=8319 RepID=A0AAV7TLJ7_PLEWA|nr:hypothetical protein NDU88_002352 [Pleurodeles waltl]
MLLRDVPQEDQERVRPKIIAEAYSSIGRDSLGARPTKPQLQGKSNKDFTKQAPEGNNKRWDKKQQTPIKKREENLPTQLAELKALVMALEHTDPAQLTLIVCDWYYCVQFFNEYLHYWRQNGFRDSKGNTIKHRLLWGKVADLKETLPNVHVVHTLGHQRAEIHVAGNTLADEAAKSVVAAATVAAVTHPGAKPDEDIWAAVKATAEVEAFHSDQGPAFASRAFRDAMTSLGVQLEYSSPFHPKGNSVVERLNCDLKQSLTARILDLDGSGVEAAETPFDINERVTVLKELQQFCDDNISASAASTGIKELPVMPQGWIPKVGNLVREKVAVKKEFGPSYRAPVSVLGIHGTRNGILPPLASAKENSFVSIDNVKLHHVADPAQLTKSNRQ